MTIEGVDYSAKPPGAAALTAAGKQFAVRYLAKDSRGLNVIDPNESRDLTDGGKDIAVVYESTETRWEAGEPAGAIDAAYAQGILIANGLPSGMPIYFAIDYDATPAQQAEIDAYLTGAADIIGLARVGIYGGYWDVSRSAANKSASWYWQTTAWSGGNLFQGAHLYQYGYNHTINGTNCDDTKALQANYGQAAEFIDHPAPPPKPMPKPPKYAKKKPITVASTFCIPTVPSAPGKKGVQYRTIVATTPRSVASSHGQPTGPDIKAGTIVTVAWWLTAKNGQIWAVGTGGSRVSASAFFPHPTTN